MKKGDKILYTITCLGCDTRSDTENRIYDERDDVLEDEAGGGRDECYFCETCEGMIHHIVTLTPDGCLRVRNEEVVK